MRRIESRFSVQRRQLKVWFVRAKKSEKQTFKINFGTGEGEGRDDVEGGEREVTQEHILR